MKTPVDMGKNRTGAAMSPKQSKKMFEFAQDARVPPGDERAMASMRGAYSSNGETIGTMPPPSSVKGAVKAAGTMMTGRKPTVLLDKLGERLAFERTGTRLYEAVRAKLAALGGGNGIGIHEEALREIQDQETEHMQLLAEAIEKLGADPTTETPSADMAGVQAMGVMQVITDPRTTIPQCLSALLTAELVDNASWEMLIELADEFGQDELVPEFRRALQEEQRHLQLVKGWLTEATRLEAHGEAAV
ncbi:ferritin-like domain-containing protein [Vulgatibacter sp.]|uniref:ferritin-like domain-containing protein n=1 Tax=Vulgatibacter sp. TaxID=1971226 RepID=UPI0035681BBC